MVGKMRAAVYHGANKVEVESVNIPEIGPTDYLLRVMACSLCKTDLKKIRDMFELIEDNPSRKHRIWISSTRRFVKLFPKFSEHLIFKIKKN